MTKILDFAAVCNRNGFSEWAHNLKYKLIQMRNYKNYHIWKDSKTLVKEVYALLSDLPSSEKFVLEAQIKRAVISIPSNIAEGVGRRTQKDFRNFLYISLGSSYEVDTLLELTVDLGFLKQTDVFHIQEKLVKIQKQISALISKVSYSINQN